MFKIISKKEYNNLIKTKEKYDFLVGNTITLNDRRKYKMKNLLNLSNEELVRIITDLNNIVWQLKRKMEDE